MELGHVTLSDGRRVDTYTGGDPDGPAVLLQHGVPGCRLTATHVDDDARAAAVRLLALSRSGFGHSSPAAPSLASCGRDAVEVAAALGAETFAVLGLSFGAPFAAATAAADPERVRCRPPEPAVGDEPDGAATARRGRGRAPRVGSGPGPSSGTSRRVSAALYLLRR